MLPSLNPSLYQLNTRVFLNELTRDLGRRATLHDLSDAFLDHVAELGFEWFWLLGVWRTGPAGRAVSLSLPREEFRKLLPDLTERDIAGSPFAVQAYRVAEDFGGNAALVSLRARLLKRGLRLMLDFVPNHTAPDHAWVAEHPEFYVQGDESDLAREPQNYAYAQTQSGRRVIAFGRDPYFSGWSDTFQLNYRSRTLRKAMTDQLVEVAGACDAVRCDMAMLLLPDVFLNTWGARALPTDGSMPVDVPFWPEAIATVRARHPSFELMAEVYWDREWELQRQGFDYTYDKRLYDRLRACDAEAVRGHLRADLEFQRKSVRFLENHDEPRAASTFAREVHRAAAVIAFCVPGMRFFYEGQLQGRRGHVSMHLGRRPDEAVDAELQRFYAQLLDALKLPVLREGHWKLLACETAWAGNSTARNILGFSWEHGLQRLLVTVNYGSTAAQCYVRQPWSDLAGASFRLRDRLSDSQYVRSGDELERQGFYLDVPAWHTHIFEIERLH